jgi:hypothetical protein
MEGEVDNLMNRTVRVLREASGPQEAVAKESTNYRLYLSITLYTGNQGAFLTQEAVVLVHMA